MKLYMINNSTFWSVQKLANSLEFIYDRTQTEWSGLIHICKRLEDTQKNGTYFNGGYIKFDYWFKKSYFCTNCQTPLDFYDLPEYSSGCEGHA